MKITIIGLGLIGGSLAIGLRESGFATKLFGVEANTQNAARALELGLVAQEARSVRIGPKRSSRSLLRWRVFLPRLSS